MASKNRKPIGIFLIIILLAALVIMAFSDTKEETRVISQSGFIALVEWGNVASVQAKPVSGQGIFQITGKTKDGKEILFNVIADDMTEGSKLRESFDRVLQHSTEIQKYSSWL